MSNIERDKLADVRDMLKNYSKLDKDHKAAFDDYLKYELGDKGDQVINILNKRNPTSRDIGGIKQQVLEGEALDNISVGDFPPSYDDIVGLEGEAPDNTLLGDFSLSDDKTTLLPSNEGKKSPEKQQVGNELKLLADAFNALSNKGVKGLAEESTRLLSQQKQEEKGKSFGDKVKSFFKITSTERAGGKDQSIDY